MVCHKIINSLLLRLWTKLYSRPAWWVSWQTWFPDNPGNEQKPSPLLLDPVSQVTTRPTDACNNIGNGNIRITYLSKFVCLKITWTLKHKKSILKTVNSKLFSTNNLGLIKDCTSMSSKNHVGLSSGKRAMSCHSIRVLFHLWRLFDSFLFGLHWLIEHQECLGGWEVNWKWAHVDKFRFSSGCCNISSWEDRVSSHFQTPRREFQNTTQSGVVLTKFEVSVWKCDETLVTKE